ncbi:MAG: AMP-dependent synthetase/ligase [Candidatus Binatia bacterium]|nr:AMP-dependent synthetase/ligase [Candidatus Binatia bacterium]
MPLGMIESPTFARGFRDAVADSPEAVAVKTLDGAVSLTYRGLAARADALAGGLAKLGLEKGSTIALMTSNRPEFHIADLAAVTLGAVPFSIYQTLSAEQITYVVGDSGARIAIVEGPFLESFLTARADLPALEHLIVLDGEAEGALSFAEVEASGVGFDGEAATKNVAPSDLLTLIYTSGTTGPPKGVQLTHANLEAVAGMLNATVPLPANGRVLSWLPTAHIAERALNYYIPILCRSTITTIPDPRQIAAALPDVRPDFFFAVPRIWEKIKAGFDARLSSGPADERRAMETALAASVEKLRLEQASQSVPEALAGKVAEFETNVFSPLRTALGFDKLAFASVGAAPTPREVLEFFHAIGIELAEGWGMSETTAIGTLSKPGTVRIGTVGKPAPGVEIKLAGDREVLIRGANIMQGYRNLPDKTAETIDGDGWLATGDVGEFDDDGYLKIVDRKKELIINAAGKNMSPANIEAALKGACSLIGQAYVIGDGRRYNTALLVLDPDFAAAWAGEQGLGHKSADELASEPRVHAAVSEGVEAGNQRLSRVEQVKKFTILPEDWLPGGDELTPTMKLKRKPIAAKYATQIDAMYEE